MKKIYLVATPILLLLVALSLSVVYLREFEEVEIFSAVFSISLVAVNLLSFVMMFRTGTFRKTIWCRFAYFGMAILIIGMLFKLQHWANAVPMLFAGSACLTLSYLIHFVRKSPKNVLDWSKAITVSVFFVNLLVTLARFSFKETFNLIAFLLGLGLICLYYVHVMKDKKQVETKLTTNGEHLFDYQD